MARAPPLNVNNQNQNQARLIIYNKGNGTVINKRTNKTAVMRALDGPPIERDDPGAEPTGYLDSRQSDCSGSAMHKHRLTSTQMPQMNERIKGGEKGDRQRAGCLES